jgi:hypothetical protein
VSADQDNTTPPIGRSLLRSLYQLTQTPVHRIAQAL